MFTVNNVRKDDWSCLKLKLERKQTRKGSFPKYSYWLKITVITFIFLQSCTKVLGTVLQYSYFSVISRFPLKTVHPFWKFLEVLPPHTLYKVETRKKFWIDASNIVCGVRGGVGPVWIGKRPRNAKVSQDVCPRL